MTDQHVSRFSRSISGISSRNAVATGIMIVAIGLRLFHLTRPGLWTDEATVMQWYATAGWFACWTDKLGTYTDWFVRQPLAKAFQTDWALRSPSVFIGALSIWLTYLLGNRLIPRYALLLMSFVALVPTHIRYSQEGRYYILVYCSVVALWLAYEMYLEAPRLRNLILLAVLFPLPSLSSITSVGLPLLLGFWYCILSWQKHGSRSLLRFFAAVAAGAMLSFPAYWRAYAMARGFGGGETMMPWAGAEAYIFKEINPELLRNALAQSAFAVFGPLNMSTVTGVAAWIVVALFLIGICYSFRLGWVRALLVASGSTIPALAILWITKDRNIAHVRYLLVSAPFVHFAMLMGLAALLDGISAVPKLMRRAPLPCVWTYVLGFLLLIGLFAGGIRDYYRDLKYSFNNTAVLFKRIMDEFPRSYIVLNKTNTRAWNIMKWYFHEPRYLGRVRELNNAAPSEVLRQMRVIDSNPDAIFLACTFVQSRGAGDDMWTKIPDGGLGLTFHQHDFRLIYIIECNRPPMDEKTFYTRRVWWTRWMLEKLPMHYAIRPILNEFLWRDELRMELMSNPKTKLLHGPPVDLTGKDFVSEAFPVNSLVTRDTLRMNRFGQVKVDVDLNYPVSRIEYELIGPEDDAKPVINLSIVPHNRRATGATVLSQTTVTGTLKGETTTALTVGKYMVNVQYAGSTDPRKRPSLDLKHIRLE